MNTPSPLKPAIVAVGLYCLMRTAIVLTDFLAGILKGLLTFWVRPDHLTPPLPIDEINHAIGAAWVATSAAALYLLVYATFAFVLLARTNRVEAWLAKLNGESAR